MWTPSHVRVTVHKARNLLGKGKNGKNDAFVIIQLKKEKFHTSVKEMTVIPEWNEECDLLIPDGRSGILITVLHRNIIGIDLFLGEVTLPLSDFDIYEQPKSRWYSLESKASKRHKEPKYRGEIEVNLEFIVKDIPLSRTPLPEKKKRTNSLINIATDVGAKLNSKFPGRHFSWKINKSNKEKSFDSPWSRHSLSEEESPYLDRHSSYDDTNEQDENDSRPITPNDSTRARNMLSQRSQSIATLPSSLKSGDVFIKSDSGMDTVFNNPHIQSLDDIRQSSLANQKEKSGSLCNLRILRPPSLTRRLTEPPILHPTKSDDNMNSLQSKKQFSRNDVRRSNGNVLLKPCFEEDVIITGRNKQLANISQDILENYGALNRQELLETIVTQKLVIENQRNKMKDMEMYIDNLVVRVMNAMPKLLQTPIIHHNTKR